MEREVSVLSAPAPVAAVAPARASIVWLGAVLLLSACGLMFELMLTRIFSATIWYHYTFVAISVALLGWGLGGFLVYVLGLAKYPRQSRSILIVLSLLLSVTLQVFLYTILQLPFTPERLNLYFLLSILPFLAGGAALSLAFEANGKDINRLYFADLIGAAAGVLIVPLLIALLGAETAILATAILPALAALLLSTGDAQSSRRPWQVLAGLVLVANVAIAGWNYKTQTWTIRDAPSKALYKLLTDHPDARIVSDHWNAYSRITAVRGFDDYHVARLFIDSDAETSVLPWDGTLTGLKDDGRYWFRAFPLRLAPEPKVLVIGPGGGTDVVMSILSGSPQVTGVEMNPLMVQAVRDFGAEAGSIYDNHPKMRLVMDEGRNFIQRTDERFDAIVLGFVDSWASVASGGLSLTENYLYTREALEAYHDHLSDRGTLAIVRWPTDVPRLVANSVDFLQARGLSIPEIGKHILAVSERVPKMTQYGLEPVETVFMLTRSPLSAEQTDALLAGFKDAHVVWSSYRPSEKPYADLFEGRTDFAAYTDAFETRATPVNDDHPFYFATDKQWWGIPAFAVRLVSIPLGAVVAFAILLMIAGKLLHFRAPGGRTIVYFGALGIGFIIVEVALVQRLILLLGHPIYTLVVILFTLLLASGIGSRFAGRFAPERIHRVLGLVIPLVIALVILGAFGLPLVVKAAIPLSQAQRIAVAVLLTFPFGFLMGMPFPLGLRRHAQDPLGAPVSSLWGINGVASVIGSIAGMMIAVAAGFTWVFVGGALCYAVAWTVRPK